MLTNAYKASFENGRLQQLLLRRENIPVLEEILAKETEELKKLQKLKKKGQLDFGEPVREEEVGELLSRVAQEVDDFLDVRNGMDWNYYFSPTEPLPSYDPTIKTCLLFPSAAGTLAALTNGPVSYTFFGAAAALAIMGVIIGYPQYRERQLFKEARELGLSGNWRYNPHSKSIFCMDMRRALFISAGAHEYTHHVQQGEGLRKRPHTIFGEGHARGVEMHIAEQHRKNDDNPAFLWALSHLAVLELKNSYLYMCGKVDELPKKSLLREAAKFLPATVDRLFSTQPSPHALGNALFRIYEVQHGKDIYRKAIHGELVFE